MTDSAANLQIRQLQLRELPELLKFQQENDYKALPEHGGERQSLAYSLLKMFWHGERLVTFVAVDDSGIIGYISLVFGKHRKFRGNAYLVSAAVKASERGKGTGTRLFDAVEIYAKSRGTRRIEFEVFAKNEKAIALYKRLGYQIEGVKRRAVDNGTDLDDLIFMAKFVD